MTLSEYLESTQLSQAQFAKLVGCTQGAVSQWLAGSVKISAEKAVAIEQATGGQVTAGLLRPDIFGDTRAA